MNKGEKIGKLDRLIKIQRRTLVENATAERVETWSDLLSVWSNVKYAKTEIREEDMNGAIYYTNRITFEIRKTDITERDRIQYNSFNWDIIRVTEDGRGGRMFIEVQKTEG